MSFEIDEKIATGVYETRKNVEDKDIIWHIVREILDENKALLPGYLFCIECKKSIKCYNHKSWDLLHHLCCYEYKRKMRAQNSVVIIPPPHMMNSLSNNTVLPTNSITKNANLLEERDTKVTQFSKAKIIKFVNLSDTNAMKLNRKIRNTMNTEEGVLDKTTSKIKHGKSKPANSLEAKGQKVTSKKSKKEIFDTINTKVEELLEAKPSTSKLNDGISKPPVNITIKYRDGNIRQFPRAKIIKFVNLSDTNAMKLNASTSKINDGKRKIICNSKNSIDSQPSKIMKIMVRSSDEALTFRDFSETDSNRDEIDEKFNEEMSIATNDQQSANSDEEYIDEEYIELENSSDQRNLKRDAQAKITTDYLPSASRRECTEKMIIAQKIENGIYKLGARPGSSIIWKILKTICTENNETLPDYVFCIICRNVYLSHYMPELLKHNCCLELKRKILKGNFLNKADKDMDNIRKEDTYELAEKIKKGIYTLSIYDGHNRIWRNIKSIVREDKTIVDDYVFCCECHKVYSSKSQLDLVRHKCLKDCQSSQETPQTSSSKDVRYKYSKDLVEDEKCESPQETPQTSSSKDVRYKYVKEILEDEKGESSQETPQISSSKDVFEILDLGEDANVDMVEKKLYEGIYTASRKDGDSVVWQTIAEILTNNGTILKTYVYCRKCSQVLRRSKGYTEKNLRSHKCIQDIVQSLKSSLAIRHQKSSHRQTIINESITPEFKGPPEITIPLQDGRYTLTKEGKISSSYTWDILSRIKDQDGQLLSNYICCNKCHRVMKLFIPPQPNIYRHKCIKEYKKTLPTKDQGKSNSLMSDISMESECMENPNATESDEDIIVDNYSSNEMEEELTSSESNPIYVDPNKSRNIKKIKKTRASKDKSEDNSLTGDIVLESEFMDMEILKNSSNPTESEDNNSSIDIKEEVIFAAPIETCNLISVDPKKSQNVKTSIFYKDKVEDKKTLISDIALKSEFMDIDIFNSRALAESNDTNNKTEDEHLLSEIKIEKEVLTYETILDTTNLIDEKLVKEEPLKYYGIPTIAKKLEDGIYILSEEKKGSGYLWNFISEIQTKDGHLLKNYVCCRECRHVLQICANRMFDLYNHKCIVEFKKSLYRSVQDTSLHSKVSNNTKAINVEHLEFTLETGFEVTASNKEIREDLNSKDQHSLIDDVISIKVEDEYLIDSNNSETLQLRLQESSGGIDSQTSNIITIKEEIKEESTLPDDNTILKSDLLYDDATSSSIKEEFLEIDNHISQRLYVLPEELDKDVNCSIIDMQLDNGNWTTGQSNPENNIQSIKEEFIELEDELVTIEALESYESFDKFQDTSDIDHEEEFLGFESSDIEEDEFLTSGTSEPLESWTINDSILEEDNSSKESPINMEIIIPVIEAKILKGIYTLIEDKNSHNVTNKSAKLIQKEDNTILQGYKFCLKCRKVQKKCKHWMETSSEIEEEEFIGTYKSLESATINDSTPEDNSSKSNAMEDMFLIEAKIVKGLYTLVKHKNSQKYKDKTAKLIQKEDNTILKGYKFCLKCRKVENKCKSWIIPKVTRNFKELKKQLEHGIHENPTKISSQTTPTSSSSIVAKTIANSENEEESDEDEEDEKVSITKKIDSDLYRIIPKEGESCVWDIIGEIQTENGDTLTNYVYCRKCLKVLRRGCEPKYLYSHKCVKDYSKVDGAIKIFHGPRDISRKLDIGVYKLMPKKLKGSQWSILYAIQKEDGSNLEDYVCCIKCHHILKLIHSSINLHFCVLKLKASEQNSRLSDSIAAPRKNETIALSLPIHGYEYIIAQRIKNGVYTLTHRRRNQNIVWHILTEILRSNSTVLNDFIYCKKCEEILRFKGCESLELLHDHKCIKELKQLSCRKDATTNNRLLEKYLKDISLLSASYVFQEDITPDDNDKLNASCIASNINRGIYTVSSKKKHEKSYAWCLIGEIQCEDGHILEYFVCCRKCFLVINYRTRSSGNLYGHSCVRALRNLRPEDEDILMNLYCSGDYSSSANISTSIAKSFDVVNNFKALYNKNRK
ncbi:uncharacterized protein LOC142222321 [Haematobia irritans]|uniref:uncharacterized protein LOC142222321 n=1 Tax=Haematobia irritans TaxID=7368 RepID=UPI003F4F8C7B